ncbi:uncharacterized protein [Amphiura filiformis]|uniref:uncharacterized protein isoform X1 n=1 Tax=Amphiura filiformis TaxID=82378 RepID=UPI003B20E6A1
MVTMENEEHEHLCEKVALLDNEEEEHEDGEETQLLPSVTHNATRSTVQNLSVSLAAVFIVGKVTGVGILVLPNALSDTGAFGIIIALLFLLGTIYSGIRLAQSWTILCNINDKYSKEISRNPYADMAFEAFGTKGRFWTTLILYIYIFALCVTDLLMIAENTEIIFSEFHIDVPLCSWLPVVTLVICPVTWFGTPKDFWLVGITSAVTSIIASVLILVGTSIDAGKYERIDVPVETWTFVAALGLIGFSFAGQSVFPTLQHDMKEPAKFVRSVVYGYAGIALLYFPTSILALWVYRAEFVITGIENIADLFSSSAISIAVTLSVNIHLILAIVIFTNTLYQDIEQVLNVPYEFNWKRCVVRTTFMVLALAMAATIPSFKTFLSIFGGPLTALVNFLLPLGIYTRLCCLPKVPVKLSTFKIVINLCVMAFAVVAGTSSTISGVYTIVNVNGTTIKPPCYVNV